MVIPKPLQPYTENDSSLSNSALKLFSERASFTYPGSYFHIGATLFRKNSSLTRTLLIGSLNIVKPVRLRLLAGLSLLSCMSFLGSLDHFIASRLLITL